MIEIRHRFDDHVLYKSEAATIAEALTEAVKEGARLEGAWLQGARLEGAWLDGAWLQGAWLQGARLQGARLDGARLEGAWLQGAWLQGARLDGARLQGAWLDGARLEGAWLQGARLDGARLNWQSHDLIAEVLRQAAGNNPRKREVAGLILISRDWCWTQFAKLRNRRGFDWALRTLAGFVQPEESGVPELLMEAVIKLKPETATKAA